MARPTPAHPVVPEVVLLDGTGVRAGQPKNGTKPHLAGLTGRSGSAGRRRARSHLFGLTWTRTGRSSAPNGSTWHPRPWSSWTARRPSPPWPSDRGRPCRSSAARGTCICGKGCARRSPPTTPPTGTSTRAGPRRSPRPSGNCRASRSPQERSTAEALAADDEFTDDIPADLASAHAYLEAAR